MPIRTKEHNQNISAALMGSKNPRWKGGKIKNVAGYILIYKPDHPFAQIRGYVFEHRLVMEKHLGRYLTKKERTHHLNDIKADNRFSNLKLLSGQGKHTIIHKPRLGTGKR